MADDETSATPLADAVKAPKAPKEPKRGVGTVAREAIAAGKSNEEALVQVLAEFPDAKTSLQTISWYRNDMRKSDPNVPTGRSVRKPAEAAEGGEPAGGSEDPLG